MSDTVELHAGVPVLRIFDVARAKEFYVDWLGCSIDFEHRFDAESLLYMQVSRDDLVLHLSEHSGDGTPGTTVLGANCCLSSNRKLIQAAAA